MPEKTSRNFCILPFVHLSASPKADFRLCCTARRPKGGDYNYGNWSKDSAFEFWNSDYMRRVRLDMLNTDKRFPECERCYHDEDFGHLSKRLRENKQWMKKPGVEERVEEARRSAGYVSDRPIYLDLRLGNLCNLKCRMCNPLNSTQWQTELTRHEAEWRDRLPYAKMVARAEEMTPWYENELFTSEIQELLPNTTHLYVTGGEPTLIPELHTLLRYAIDFGYSRNIKLRFNTNVTELRDSWLELLPHFKAVVCSLSIDAYGTRNDWLRHPSKWKEVDVNTGRYCSMPGNVQVLMNTVVSVYNALYIGELIDWRRRVESRYGKSITHRISLLTNPRQLKAQLLPEHLKEEIKRRMLPYVDNVKGVLPMLRYLDKQANEDQASLLNLLKEHTHMIDRWRGENYLSVFPDLGFIDEPASEIRAAEA